MDAPGLQFGDFIQLWFSEPEDHVTATQKGISINFDARAGLFEGVIRVASALACTGLNDNVGAEPDEFFYCLRGDGRTVFTRVCLTGYR
jgi:hypothetical protein